MPVAKVLRTILTVARRESINLSHLEGVQEPKSQLSPRMKLAVRRKSLSGNFSRCSLGKLSDLSTNLEAVVERLISTLPMKILNLSTTECPASSVGANLTRLQQQGTSLSVNKNTKQI